MNLAVVMVMEPVAAQCGQRNPVAASRRHANWRSSRKWSLRDHDEKRSPLGGATRQLQVIQNICPRMNGLIQEGADQISGLILIFNSRGQQSRRPRADHLTIDKL